MFSADSVQIQFLSRCRKHKTKYDNSLCNTIATWLSILCLMSWSCSSVSDRIADPAVVKRTNKKYCRRWQSDECNCLFIFFDFVNKQGDRYFILESTSFCYVRCHGWVSKPHINKATSLDTNLSDLVIVCDSMCVCVCVCELMHVCSFELRSSNIYHKKQ